MSRKFNNKNDYVDDDDDDFYNEDDYDEQIYESEKSVPSKNNAVNVQHYPSLESEPRSKQDISYTDTYKYDYTDDYLEKDLQREKSSNQEDWVNSKPSPNDIIDKDINFLLDSLNNPQIQPNEIDLIESALQLLTTAESNIKSHEEFFIDFGLSNKNEPRLKDQDQPKSTPSLLYQSFLPCKNNQGNKITLEDYLKELYNKHNYESFSIIKQQKERQQKEIKEQKEIKSQALHEKFALSATKQKDKSSEQKPSNSKFKILGETTPSSLATIPDKLMKIYQETSANIYKGKPHIYLIITGHVDAGKSTLMGHFLYLLKHVSEKNMESLKKDSKRIGKSTFEFAWILDDSSEERKRGITVDIASYHFQSPQNRFTLLDSPGHRDFMSNMINGSFLSDASILVIDSSKDEFEKGMLGQTKEQIKILKYCNNISCIIVAVNKMEKCNWSKQRFDFIKSEILTYVNSIGLCGIKLTFIPLSGYLGINLIQRNVPSSGSWYSDETLLEILDNLCLPPSTGLDQGSRLAEPFRAIVYQILHITGAGNVVVEVKILGGYSSLGNSLISYPSGQKCSIKELQIKTGTGTIDKPSQQTTRNIFYGDSAIITLSGIEEGLIKNGDLVFSSSLKAIACTTKVICRLHVFSDMSHVITKGTTALFHYRNTLENCIINELINLVDSQSLEIIKNKPRFLTKDNVAHIEILFQRKIAIESIESYKPLSYFILKVSGLTIASGNVVECI